MPKDDPKSIRPPGEFDGEIITCPMCGEEDVTLKTNRRGAPYHCCRTFGCSAINYNNAAGKDFIRKRIKENLAQKIVDGSKAAEEPVAEPKKKDDDWFKGKEE